MSHAHTMASRKTLNKLLEQAQSFFEEDKYPHAAPVLLHAWHEVLEIMERKQIHTLEEFDRQHPTCMKITDLILLLDAALLLVGKHLPEYLHERIALSKIVVDRFKTEIEPEDFESLKLALPETIFVLGDVEKAEELFEQWLQQDPRWGRCWLCWALCYCTAKSLEGQFEKAERIIRRALAIPNVSESFWLSHTLVEVLNKLGRDDEASSIRKELLGQLKVKAAGELLCKTCECNRKDRWKELLGQIKVKADEELLCKTCECNRKHRWKTDVNRPRK